MTAEENWSSLRLAEQVALARKVAQRRARELRQNYPNVLSVGVGYKSKGGRRYSHRICIRFLVDRKLKRVKGRCIPSHLHANAVIEGRQVRCAIPTDVEIFGRGLPHSNGTGEVGDGVIAGPIGGGAGPSVRGAACCIVCNRNNSEDRFLLGCHHVFTRSGSINQCSPLDPTQLSHSTTGHHIGPLFDYTSLTPGQGFGLDAALAQIDDPTWLRPSFHGVTPLAVADGIGLPSDYMIYTPRGPRRARYMGEQFDTQFRYTCGAIVRIAATYQSSANTIAGDSGSPLIGADGTLFGMHFYGTKEGFSYAIPAYVLFQSGLFIIDIDLP